MSSETESMNIKEIEKEIKESEEETYIKVLINDQEINRIPLGAVSQETNIKNIIFKEAKKSPEILAVEEFFVKINGKIVIPKEIKDMSIQDVKIIEIFDNNPEKS